MYLVKLQDYIAWTEKVTKNTPNHITMDFIKYDKGVLLNCFGFKILALKIIGLTPKTSAVPHFL